MNLYQQLLRAPTLSVRPTAVHGDMESRILSLNQSLSVYRKLYAWFPAPSAVNGQDEEIEQVTIPDEATRDLFFSRILSGHLKSESLEFYNQNKKVDIADTTDELLNSLFKKLV
jgi:hypothetical protein